MEKEVIGGKTKTTIESLLKSRKRHRWEPMKLSRFKRKVRSVIGNDLNEKEFLEFFDKLEKNRYGTIVWSKHGNPVAFRWAEPITRLKAFAAAQKLTISTPKEDENKTHLIVVDGPNKIKVELFGNLDTDTKKKLANLIMSI